MVRMLAAGKTKAIDLGRAGERRFGIVADAGFDGDTAHRLARWRQTSGRLERVSQFELDLQTDRRVRLFIPLPDVGN